MSMTPERILETKHWAILRSKELKEQIASHESSIKVLNVDLKGYRDSLKDVSIILQQMEDLL